MKKSTFAASCLAAFMMASMPAWSAGQGPGPGHGHGQGHERYRDYDRYDGYRDRPYDESRHHYRHRHHEHRGHDYVYQGHWRSWNEWDRYVKRHPELRRHGRYYREGVHLMFRTCPEPGTCIYFSIGR